jgi:hypothetical protein
MESHEYDVLAAEKQKLYQLLAEAREAGVSLCQARAVIEQSEKIDSLVNRMQTEKRRDSERHRR